MNSIVSYPERGDYGSSRYRGNCSGNFIKEVLGYFKPSVFVDPCEGGGTSRDVANELISEGKNIEFHGFDLHSGFNLIRDNLRERVGKSADYIFFHAPYHFIVEYSGKGKMWGDAPHKDDLSRCASYEEFLAKMRLAMQNIYDATARKGNYSVLIGDIRKNGVYTSIQADLIQLAPGELDGIVIKAQHNCVSDRRDYGNSKFIPIRHEYLINFRKSRTVFGIVDTSLAVSKRLENLADANWKAVVEYALNRLDGKAELSEIYSVIAQDAPERIAPRPNWQARVRAVLQKHFHNAERGVWAIT